MSLLSKKDILAASDLPTRDVDVPEWGGTVRIRSMSAAERDAFEAEQLQARTDGHNVLPNLRARYVSACIIDDAGNLVFDDADVTALGRKSAAALDRVFNAVFELNKLDASAIEAAAGN